ncbi:MAG: hypothetical protein IKQ87_00965 [Clostridia bacterium]|nr:hypothetical protein [Clostridia bacterium]
MDKIRYKFIFRCPGEECVLVRHVTRPGDAESCARKMARLVAKKMGWAEAVCVWMGPESNPVPAEVRAEIGKGESA